jgi:hypothetical protein
VSESLQRTIKLRPDKLVWRQVGEEVMVLDTRTSEYLSVNKAGAVLWPMLLEGSTPSQLAMALVDEFGIDQARAEADAYTFLSALEEMGLTEEPAAP